MLKQLETKRVEKLEHQLDQAYRIINELLGALTCPSEELRMLARDVAISYMEAVHAHKIKTDTSVKEGNS